MNTTGPQCPGLLGDFVYLSPGLELTVKKLQDPWTGTSHDITAKMLALKYVEIAHLGRWKMTCLLDKRVLGNMISSSLELPASRRDGKMFLSCHSRQMYIVGFLP